MFRQLKFIIKNSYIRNIIIFLSIFNLEAYAEIKIIAKEGDTLLKLSKEYGVSLKELMYKNNFNDANKILENQRIIIPKDNLDKNNRLSKKYKVKEGDTIYNIGRRYQIKPIEIISINNLNDASYLKAGQTILLPYRAIDRNISSENDFKFARKKVSYHQQFKNETLSEIAKIHSIKLEDIMNLNNLNNISNITPNFKLKIRKGKPNKWKKYGSLVVNWSEWRYFDGIYMTKVKNKKDMHFFLAVNCERRILNNTLINSSWTNWYFPEIDFENKLINDFCDKDFKL